MVLCWCFRVGGARAAGQWVQLHHDEDMGPMHGMYRTLDAKFEVQRTIKRAELITFLCLLRKAIGLTMGHVDNKEIIGGLMKGTCIGPREKDANWRELHRAHHEGMLVEVEHVKVKLHKEGSVNEKSRRGCKRGSNVGRESCGAGTSEQNRLTRGVSVRSIEQIGWCTETDKYRCMRYGRGSKHMKMSGRCTGRKLLSESSGKWDRGQLGGGPPL